MVDIFGLIEGVYEGIGLGDWFLGYVECMWVLLYLVDGFGEEDLGEVYKVVCGELDVYGVGLMEKFEIVVLFKCDVLIDELIEEKVVVFEVVCG